MPVNRIGAISPGKKQQKKRSAMAPRIETDRYSASGVELAAKGSAHAIAQTFSRIRTQDESSAIF